MKLDREELLRKLEAVSAGLAIKEAVEQSSCFVFTDGQVITFNDEIACQIECDIGIEGAVAAKPLLLLLDKLAEKDIDISQDPKDSGRVLVKGKGRRSGITREAEIKLPVEAVETPEDWKDLDPEFSDAIDVVQGCASKDRNKFHLTCVHITPDYVEATDNFQLARFHVETGLEDECLVKRDCVKHLVGLGMTKISRSETWLHFQNPSGLIVSLRREQTDYPDLGSILDVDGIPTTLPGGLAEAIDKAEIFSAESSEENVVRVAFKNNRMFLKGAGASGWYEERKDVKWAGEPLAFKIEPKLLATIVERTNDCIVSENAIKIDGGKFAYVTCTSEDE